MFKPATKEKSKLRLALMGPSGSGKTYTALLFGTVLGKKVAVIDSERGSASKYADLYSFDTCDLETHSPQQYVKAIKAAEQAGYEVLIIDSLSHAWAGKDGALEQVDKAAKRSQSGNSFAAWREVTPEHNALVDAILQSKCHVIATMRTKQEYILEENEKGRKVPKKVGMAPVQREGVEYEFDVIADMNIDHDLIVAKTRCAALDGLVTRKPTAEVAMTLANWLNGGSEPAPKNASSASENTKQVTGSAVGSEAKATLSPGTSATPALCTSGTGKKNSVTADPKSTGTQTSSASSGTTNSAAVKTVSKDEIQQLLQVGTANGWSRAAISQWICEMYKLTAATITQLTQKQWESAVKVIGRPENAGGKVVVNGDGRQILPEFHWPKA